MRLNLAGGVLAALVLVALLIAYGSLFTVYRPTRCWWCGSASRSAPSPSRG